MCVLSRTSGWFTAVLLSFALCLMPWSCLGPSPVSCHGPVWDHPLSHAMVLSGIIPCLMSWSCLGSSPVSCHGPVWDHPLSHVMVLSGIIPCLMPWSCLGSSPVSCHGPVWDHPLSHAMVLSGIISCHGPVWEHPLSHAMVLSGIIPCLMPWSCLGSSPASYHGPVWDHLRSIAHRLISPKQYPHCLAPSKQRTVCLRCLLCQLLTIQCHHVHCVAAAVSLYLSQLWPCQPVVADHLVCVMLGAHLPTNADETV